MVTVGLTAQCPYGLGPCWGGAYSALSHLDDVAYVEPVPNQTDQTAQVHLTHQGLPDVARWPAQFARWANASYTMRGVEVTLTGTLVDDHAGLSLISPGLERPLQLRRLRPGVQLAWDIRRRRSRPLTVEQRDAYVRLLELRGRNAGATVTVTGPLRLVRGHPVLSVGSFHEVL